MTNLQFAIPCYICETPLTLGLCRPSRAGKQSLHIRCPEDGRHLRGFIAHQPLVEEILDRLKKFAAGEINSPESWSDSDDSQPRVEESDAC